MVKLAGNMETQQGNDSKCSINEQRNTFTEPKAQGNWLLCLKKKKKIMCLCNKPVPWTTKVDHSLTQQMFTGYLARAKHHTSGWRHSKLGVVPDLTELSIYGTTNVCKQMYNFELQWVFLHLNLQVH